MIESLLCLAILIHSIAMYFIYDALNYRIQRQEVKVKELTTMIKDISGIKYQLMDFVGRVRILEDAEGFNRQLYHSILNRLSTTEDNVLQLYNQTRKFKPKNKNK